LKDVSPILCQWDITRGCNFFCSFCLSNSGKASENELGATDALKVVDRLSDAGIFFLRILGGEPFYRKDIVTIMRHAVDHGMMLSFSTNGSLITREVAKEVKKLEGNINYFQISLYGTDKASYQKTTTNPMAFGLVQNGIQKFVEQGLHPALFWVLTSENMDQLKKAFHLASSFGLPELRISPKLNLGRGVENCEDGNIGSSEGWAKTISILQHLKTLSDASETTKAVLHARPLLGEHLYLKTGLTFFYISCKAATTMIYVDAEGGVSPCPFAPFMPENYRVPGVELQSFNILTNRFSEIWESEMFESYRQMADPAVNPKEFFTDCPNFRAGRCNPCVYTPCTCRSTIRMINQGTRLTSQ